MAHSDCSTLAVFLLAEPLALVFRFEPQHDKTECEMTARKIILSGLPAKISRIPPIAICFVGCSISYMAFDDQLRTVAYLFNKDRYSSTILLVNRTGTKRVGSGESEHIQPTIYGTIGADKIEVDARALGYHLPLQVSVYDVSIFYTKLEAEKDFEQHFPRGSEVAVLYAEDWGFIVNHVNPYVLPASGYEHYGWLNGAVFLLSWNIVVILGLLMWLFRRFRRG